MSLYFYVAPLEFHRSLEPSRMREVGERQHAAYRAKEPASRQLGEAVVAGALRGAARSRSVLGIFAVPNERLFGTDAVRRPSLTRGLAPYVFASTFALTEAVVLPRLASCHQLLQKKSRELVSRLGPVHLPVSTERQSAIAISLQLKLAFLPAGAAVTLGFYTSAAAKAATAVPGAILGALLGASQHLLASAADNSDHMAVDFGTRGARNEELFGSMASVREVPPRFFFLSEDKFGFDVRELYLWLQQSGGGVNPHTNLAFDAADLGRLASHPSCLFNDLRDGSPLMAWDWPDCENFLYQISRALRDTGPSAHSLRWEAAGALEQALEQAERSKAAGLRHFLSTLSGVKVPELLLSIRTDAEASFEFGSYLELQCEEYRMTTATHRAVRLGYPWMATTDLLFSESLLQQKQQHALQRAPWVRPLYVRTEGLGAPPAAGAIDLTLPSWKNAPR